MHTKKESSSWRSVFACIHIHTVIGLSVAQNMTLATTASGSEIPTKGDGPQKSMHKDRVMSQFVAAPFNVTVTKKRSQDPHITDVEPNGPRPKRQKKAPEPGPYSGATALSQMSLSQYNACNQVQGAVLIRV